MKPPIDCHVIELYDQALAARAVGELELAHHLFIQASRDSETLGSCLWLRLRAVYLQAHLTGELAPSEELLDIADEASIAQLRGIEADARATLAAVNVDVDMTAAIESMARAISIAESTPDSPELVLTLINIGVACGLLGLSSVGHVHFERALRLNNDMQYASYLTASLGDAFAIDALERPHSESERTDLLWRSIEACTETLRHRVALGELVMETLCLRTRAVCFIELGYITEANSDLIEIRHNLSMLSSDPTFGDVDYIEAAVRWRREVTPGALETLARSRANLDSRRGLPLISRVLNLRSEICRYTGDIDGAFVALETLTQHQLAETRRERDLRSGFLDLAVDLLNAQTLSLQDPLTGLPNRRALQRDLETMLNRGGPIVVAAIDIDHFKLINDEIGYQTGDEVIRHFALVLNRATRRDDVIARLGGDEFVVAVACADPTEGRQRLDEIRQAIASYNWAAIHPSLHLTASIGAVFGLAEERPMADLWIGDAAVSMRAAKVSGRNTVSMT
jgi:diguanylate cyclase (GGDEF)-like protein